jgi:ankyrin repeat protein
VQINEYMVIDHLFLAAKHGSIEARLVIGAGQYYPQKYVESPIDNRQSQLVLKLDGSESEATRKALDRINREAARFALTNSRYIIRLRLWNQENQRFGYTRPFIWDNKTYFWNKLEDRMRIIDASDHSGIPIWAIIISHETLDSTLRIGRFLEVAVTIGAIDWLKVALDHAATHQNMDHDHQLSTLHKLLTVSVRTGCTQIMRYILERISHLQRPSKGLLDTSGASPFHFLSMIDMSKQELNSLASQFLKTGIDIEHVVYSRSWSDPTGIEVYGSALQMAVQLRGFDAIETLLLLGANPLLTEVKQPNPFEMAIALHLPEVVTLFLEKIRHLSKPLGQYATALSSITSKGAFDRMLLHSRFETLLEDFRATLDVLAARTHVETTQTNSVPKTSLGAEEEELALISCIRQGPKDPILLQLLLQHGVRLRDYEAQARVLAESSARIGDDPHNRGLMRTLLGIEPEDAPWRSTWNKFFQNYRYFDQREGRSLTLLEYWTTKNLINNVQDLLAHPGMDSMITKVDNGKNTPFDISIRRDLLEMYLLLEPFYSSVDVQRRLALSVESSALKVISHIVQQHDGTIYCSSPESRYTALHHAVRVSNHTVLQHLLEIQVPTDAVLATVGFNDPDWSPNLVYGTSHLIRPFQSVSVLHMRENSKANSFTALECAVINKDVACVRALTQHTGTVQSFYPLPAPNMSYKGQKGLMSSTCLAFAIRRGEVEIAKLMKTNPRCSAFCRSSGITLPKLVVSGAVPWLRQENLDTLMRAARLDGWTFVNEAIVALHEGALNMHSFLSLTRFGDPQGNDSILPDTTELLRRLNPFTNHHLWNGWHSIHFAIYYGNIDAVGAFLELGTSPKLQATALTIENGASLQENLEVWSPLFDYKELFAKDSQLDKLGNMKKLYRHAKLWGPNQIAASSLNILAVHDLLWAGKTCLEIARDLIAWNEYVKVPQPGGLQPCAIENRRQVHKILQEAVGEAGNGITGQSTGVRKDDMERG